MTGRTFDIQLATDQVNSLLHACQSETGPITVMFGVEAYTVIAHANLKTVVQALERNLRSASPGMATDILKSFLCDPKKAKRDLFPRRDEIFLNLYIYRN